MTDAAVAGVILSGIGLVGAAGFVLAVAWLL